MTVTVIGDNTGDDFAGTEDTELRGGTGNLGSATTINYKNYTVTPVIRTGLLSFSGLSNIPATDTVSAATIGKYFTLNQGGSTYLDFQVCLRDWVELEATDTLYSTGNSWTSSYAQSDGNDRDATISAALTYGSLNTYNTASSAQLAADVEDFIDGTLSNYGWVLTQEAQAIDATDIHRFVTSEGTDGQRPYLSVTHAAAVGVTIPILRRRIEGY